MSPLPAVINPFPWEGSVPLALAGLAADFLVVAMIGTVVAVGVMAVKVHRRRGSLGHARDRGLSRSSSLYLARALGRERATTIRALLEAPDLLRERLATQLGRLSRRESAERFSHGAAKLLDELGVRAPLFEGAPLMFERVIVRDRTRPNGPSLTAFVADLDEHTLTLITPHPCPWPARQELSVELPDRSRDETFEARLQLQPRGDDPEWVLDHSLEIESGNRRLVPRVPCDRDVWLLRASVEVSAVRDQMRSKRPPRPGTLQRTDAWVARRRARLIDLSTHGAGLVVHHDVLLGQRFHVALFEDGTLVGLPLAEVVDVRPRPDGRLRVGTRFYGMRLKERLRLADLVRRISRQGGLGLRTTTIKRAAGLSLDSD